MWEYCQLSLVIGSFVLLASPMCQNGFGFGRRGCAEGLSYMAHKTAVYYAAISGFQGASQKIKKIM